WSGVPLLPPIRQLPRSTRTIPAAYPRRLRRPPLHPATSCRSGRRPPRRLPPSVKPVQVEPSKGQPMYIAMNRFKVVKGSEEAFENVWKTRDRRLNEMKGFREFHLLKGPENAEEGYTLYASHTVWASEEDFRD